MHGYIVFDAQSGNSFNIIDGAVGEIRRWTDQLHKIYGYAFVCVEFQIENRMFAYITSIVLELIARFTAATSTSNVFGSTST